MSENKRNAYWRANINLMLVLLAIWFAVSFLAGIVFVDSLNQFRLFGYKLGFWFSQQGSVKIPPSIVKKPVRVSNFSESRSMSMRTNQPSGAMARYKSVQPTLS